MTTLVEKTITAENTFSDSSGSMETLTFLSEAH